MKISRILRPMTTHKGRRKKGDPEKIVYIYQYCICDGKDVSGIIWAYNEEEAREYLSKNGEILKHIEANHETFIDNKLRVIPAADVLNKSNESETKTNGK